MCDLRELTKNGKALLENIVSSAVPDTGETNKNSYGIIKDLASSTVISALDHAVPVLGLTISAYLILLKTLKTQETFEFLTDKINPFLGFLNAKHQKFPTQTVLHDWENCARLGVEHITKNLSKVYDNSKDVYNVSRETALGVLYLPLLLYNLFLDQKR